MEGFRELADRRSGLQRACQKKACAGCLARNDRKAIDSMYYFTLNNPDWALSTQHLSPTEEGVYFRLIRHYYDTEKPIPLEIEPVLRRLRLTEYADLVNDLLEEFFKKTDKGWKKNRCNKEIKLYKKKATTSRENGRSGGRPKKNKDIDETQGKPSGLPEETLTNNQEPLTTNQEPETKNSISPAQAVFDYWKTITGKKRSKLNTTVRAKINTRLKSFTVEQLKQAINGNAASKFHQGQNDNNRKYNSLELICRNDEKTQGFIDMASQDNQHQSDIESWINGEQPPDESIIDLDSGDFKDESE